MTATVAAIVPMRHHSERVPGKNYRSFAGRPLYHWIVETLLAAGSVQRVVIDTDSEWIREDVGEHFPSVLCLERPSHLREGATPMNDILLHTTQQVDADVYLQTHSTNPLLLTSSIEAALARFLAARPTFDSLFSVSRLQCRLWDGLARPINHNPAILLRTQDLPAVYEENSCLYLFSRDVLVAHRSRIGQRPLLFELEREEAWDIDEEADFQIAELLFRRREGLL